ncbi:major facilitator superfamily domain-containing protein [Clohesyomyces aquaticus]|uniref:Major facilitator superfamily domain-containing protein n=1 Tax=Clohesyomyces aquaticus TaxID=1231657 RepID=A0A1Y1ZG92_9PLEO|nr:major facilitator superfamily domain-containing protein [Clohesyomyces aquaticus]
MTESNLSDVRITTRPESDSGSLSWNKGHCQNVDSTGQTQTSEPPEFVADRRLLGIIACQCLMTLVVALDATTLSVALPTISMTLNGTALEAYWTGTSFLLASTIVQPTVKSISHSFGRLMMIQFSLVVFIAGSLAAALAPSFTVLILGRTIQGIGAGGLVVLSEVLITDLVPLRERGIYYGYISATWAVGSVCGPLLGGALTEIVSVDEMKLGGAVAYGGWRLIFWFNIPIAMITLVVMPLLLRLKAPMAGASLKEKLVSVDWIGALLLTVSTTAILLAVTSGGVQFPWKTWHNLLLLLGGVCVFMAWVSWCILTPHPNPSINMRIFGNQTAAASYLGIYIQGINLYCLLYYLPLYYEACHSMTPLKSGIALLPEMLTVAPIAFGAGIRVSKIGKYRWCVHIGWMMTTIGLGIMCLLDQDSHPSTWVVINILPGVGFGLLFPGLEFAIQAAAGQGDVADAATMYNFIRALGQATGVAIGGAIFQNQFTKEFSFHLKDYSVVVESASQYTKDPVALIGMLATMAAPIRRQLEMTYAGSLKTVWAVNAGLAGMALLVSLFTKELSLNEALQSQQGLREPHGHCENDTRV